MCDKYWEKRGDTWVLAFAAEDEIDRGREVTNEEVREIEFLPVKPALEEPHGKRHPRALTR